jgi:hypothetical protein
MNTESIIRNTLIKITTRRVKKHGDNTRSSISMITRGTTWRKYRMILP